MPLDIFVQHQGKFIVTVRLIHVWVLFNKKMIYPVRLLVVRRLLRYGHRYIEALC